MSAPLFSVFPVELICRVFELLDSFSEVAALAKTERIFYHTWRKHVTSISRAVGRRSIPNFTEAEHLLDMQEQAEKTFQAEDDDEQQSLIRVTRLLTNARGAMAACADWVDFCQIQDTVGAFHRGPEGSPGTYMQPSECERFERSLYILWTIGTMQSAPHLQHRASAFLETCSAHDLIKLQEMATWGSDYNNNEFGTTGLDLREEVWQAGYDIVLKYWKEYLEKVASTPGPDGHYTPIGFFAFFNHTQRYLEMYEDR